MSGLEVVVPIAGKAVAPVAARLSLQLAKSLTFRWRVARKVQAAVPVSYSRRSFRLWLKTTSRRDLNDPIEVGAPKLALRLDERLSADAGWRDSDDRHSNAMRLVEATYDAMISLTQPGEASVLRDHWDRSRHDQVVFALSELLALTAKLMPADSAMLLRRESAARRLVRLEAFGVDAAVLDDTFDVLASYVPAPKPGQVAVLTGPFGSGKTELAEEWFRGAVDRYAAEGAAPHPVWLHARELRSQVLNAALLQRMSRTEFTSHGASVVVDGLDEVEAVLSARIVTEAKVFVATNRNSAALLTCRPGVLPPSLEQTYFQGLSQEEATLLIERVAGSARMTWGWNPLLVDAVRRPFFALAAATAIREGERPAGQADLIGRLVERALGPDSTVAPAVHSAEVHQLLVKMAISATNSRNATDGLAFRERQLVRTSTLVYDLDASRLEFTLPIFQQWFAAQAVLDDPAQADAAIATPESYDSWRWALAIAGVASAPDQLDTLLARVFRWNPGAGSWLLSQISEGHHWFRSTTSDSLDQPVAQARVLRATESVISALGDLAPLVFPVTRSDEPFTLGVSTRDQQLSLGWLLEPTDRTRVIELPATVGPFNQDLGHWRWERTGSVSEGVEWPWILPVDRVASATLALLNKSLRLGPSSGVWRREGSYRAARRLVGDRSVLHPPMVTLDVLTQARELLARADDPAMTMFIVHNREVHGQDLLNLVSVLSAHDGATFGRLVPGPDVPPEKVASGWIWDRYSDQQLQRFYAEAYGLACDAYDEIVATDFSTFDWAMGTGAEGAVGVIAHLSFHDAGVMGSRTPGVSTVLVPLPILEHAAAQADAPVCWSTNRRAVVSLGGLTESRDDWVFRFAREKATDDEHTSTSPFARGWTISRSVADESNHARPASALAAAWLWSDLQALKLAKGTFPQLES